MKYLTIDRAIIIIMAISIVFLCYRQAHIDAIQGRKVDEWFSNASATLEGMEYEMSRLMNAADTTAWKHSEKD